MTASGCSSTRPVPSTSPAPRSTSSRACTAAASSSPIRRPRRPAAAGRPSRRSCRSEPGVRGATRVAYEHVVFDLDGTLIDSRADLAAAVNHVLDTLGVPEVAATTLIRYVGEGARVLVERALGPAHQNLLPRALERFMARYGAHLLETTRPYPGIPEALAALATYGVALSVLTNKPVAMSRAILEGLGLASHFVAVLGGDSLPVKKPDPAGVEHLRELTGTPS